MEDKVLEEIQFHQDTVSRDANSPLHLIREKEMEISRRVLAAKKEAEEIVATARKKSVEVVQSAEEEGNRLAQAHEKVVLAEVEAEKETVQVAAVSDIEAIEKLVSERSGTAVAFVVDTVTSV